MTNTLFPGIISDAATNTSLTDSFTGFSLKVMVSHMIGHLTGTINKNTIRIENRISADFKLYTNQSKVTPVIYEMLATVISNARNTSLTITAEKFIDTITLTVEDGNNYNGYALSFSLIAIEMQARMAGGNLFINGAQKRVASVSLSFPDLAAQSSGYKS
jgi:hypothetical protein